MRVIVRHLPQSTLPQDFESQIYKACSVKPAYTSVLPAVSKLSSSVGFVEFSAAKDAAQSIEDLRAAGLEAAIAANQASYRIPSSASPGSIDDDPVFKAFLAGKFESKPEPASIADTSKNSVVSDMVNPTQSKLKQKIQAEKDSRNKAPRPTQPPSVTHQVIPPKQFDEPKQAQPKQPKQVSPPSVVTDKKDKTRSKKQATPPRVEQLPVQAPQPTRPPTAPTSSTSSDRPKMAILKRQSS